MSSVLAPVKSASSSRARIVGTGEVDASALPSNLTFTTPDSGSFKKLKQIPEDVETGFSFVESQGKVLLFFGVPCFLPKQKIEVDGAYLSFKAGRKAADGKYSGTFKFRPGDNFSISQRFVDAVR